MTSRWIIIVLGIAFLFGAGCSQDPEAWRSSGRGGADRTVEEAGRPPVYHSPIGRWRNNHRALVARNQHPDERYFSSGECRVCHDPENSCNACHDFIGIARIAP